MKFVQVQDDTEPRMSTDQGEAIHQDIESLYNDNFCVMQGIWNLMMIPCIAEKYRVFKEILDMHDSAARYWPEEEK